VFVELLGKYTCLPGRRGTVQRERKLGGVEVEKRTGHIATDVPHWLRDAGGNHDNELAGSVDTT